MSARGKLGWLTCACALLLALLAPAAAQADFGIKAFSITAIDEAELPDNQAGSHPFEYIVNFTMNQNGEDKPEGKLSELFLELPPGLVGNPLSLPRCKRADFDMNLVPACRGNAQVGVIDLELEQGAIHAEAPVYNITPSPGSPATLGTSIDNNNSFQEASLRTGSDYGVTIADITVPTKVEIQRVSVHIWGQPMLSVHDPQRTCVNPIDPELAVIIGCSSDTEPAPFLSLPTSCAGPLSTTVKVLSLQGGKDSAKSISPGLENCEALHFLPAISARPETAAADSPTGLAVGIHIPQDEAPKQLASAHLRETVVTLPAGLTVNPSAAIGRGACSPAQIDLHGTGAANCPADSKLGTVAVESPLVDHPLPGSVYLAAQGDNPFGSLLALYVTVNDPLTGIVVKLAGKVEPDQTSGQLKATFKENPQLPFEDFKLNFFGGPRAALTTPPTCGTYTTETQMTPWSAPEGLAATPFDAFAVTEGANGGPCPASEAQMPNAPSFEAGTSAPVAGAYSPFVLKLSRENGSQRLAALNVTMPPGLSAKLAGVAECSEPQIAAALARKNPGEGALELAAPSCPKSSEIGFVNVGAGSGSPLYVQGHAYLAGPYKGAPLSLVIITPAVAGPFDLGVVVVRSALFVDESTAQVTVKSDPLPSILQGIPLEVRSVAVHVDRDQFTLNPTNCAAKEVKAQALSPLGASGPLGQHFQVAGCRGLEFTPKIALRFSGGTRRTNHPAFKATLTRAAGQANFGKVSVTLPSTQFIDQNHVGNPCTRPRFAEEKCPPISELGTVTAYTPLLDKPLTGKVYFRANGGERPLPDVVADLHGQVHFVLVGFVDSLHKKGSEQSRVRTTFAQNPDAPVSKVVISLFGGKRGVLVNSQNLCKTKVPQSAIVKMAGQNGRSHDSEPKIANNCPKKK
jgi:hypothetical protein